MTWVLVITSLIVVWVASLIKLLHSPSKDAFLTNSGVVSNRNVLLVIAHPDDESMFFSPTASYLTSRGYNLHILCLSIGDADGKGDIRKQELLRACAVLMVAVEQVKCLDHPDLQDGFGKVWNHTLLAQIIGQEVIDHNIDMIITFDNYGVSGHCNHRDIHHGVQKLLQEKDIETWELVSISLARKYTGPVDVWLSHFGAMQPSKRCLVSENPRKSFLAMSQHSSQWLWYRKLFVAFSSYTYLNTLRRIN